MLGCEFPFNGNDVKSIAKEVKTKQPVFETDELKKVSSTCKDLILQLLKKDKKDRLDVIDALKHKWFEDENVKIQNINLSVDLSKKALDQFTKYSQRSKLYKAIKLLNSKLKTKDS